MRILVNLPSSFATSTRLAAAWRRLAGAHTVTHAACDRADEIRPLLAEADGVIMWSWPELDAALLDAAPRLRFAGHIDLRRRAGELALARGLAVSTARRCWAPSVAEMALALILACLRRTTDHHARMRAGTERWVRSFPEDVDPRERELTGRSVGLVGFGAVGRRLRELLVPFAGVVRTFDPWLDDGVARDHRVERVDLDTLVASSEVVVLCASTDPQAPPPLDARRIAALRPDAVLVNVARGALVDHAALAQRLARGDLVAALDVFATEPLPAGDPLRALDGALLTPHRAGGTWASVARGVDWLVDDALAWFAGRRLAQPLTAAMLPGLDA